jgi:hypothetical protein
VPLWRAVVADFDLDEHERLLLLNACRTADLCDRLEVVLVEEGPLADSSQGVRVHPAAAELRQQRITLARLLAVLNVPVGEQVDAPPVRPPRGVYAVRGGAG